MVCLMCVVVVCFNPYECGLLGCAYWKTPIVLKCLRDKELHIKFSGVMQHSYPIPIKITYFIFGYDSIRTSLLLTWHFRFLR